VSREPGDSIVGSDVRDDFDLSVGVDTPTEGLLGLELGAGFEARAEVLRRADEGVGLAVDVTGHDDRGVQCPVKKGECIVDTIGVGGGEPRRETRRRN
jgi:hypothetical protein